MNGLLIVRETGEEFMMAHFISLIGWRMHSLLNIHMHTSVTLNIRQHNWQFWNFGHSLDHPRWLLEFTRHLCVISYQNINLIYVPWGLKSSCGEILAKDINCNLSTGSYIMIYYGDHLCSHLRFDDHLDVILNLIARMHHFV